MLLSWKPPLQVLPVLKPQPGSGQSASGGVTAPPTVPGALGVPVFQRGHGTKR